QQYRDPPVAPPFPTRRSSDLDDAGHLPGVGGLTQDAVDLRARWALRSTSARRQRADRRGGRERDGPFQYVTASVWRRRHGRPPRSEEHTSELQSRSELVCRLM